MPDGSDGTDTATATATATVTATDTATATATATAAVHGLSREGRLAAKILRRQPKLAPWGQIPGNRPATRGRASVLVPNVG